MLKKLFSTLFFITLFSSPVLSDQALVHNDKDSTIKLPPIKVFAPTWNKSELLTGKPHTKVECNSWNNLTNLSISDILDGISGVAVRTPGGPGHVASPNLGGLSGNKILVIKDGLPINDPFTGSPDIGNYCSDAFESVEVWHGNQASRWGSNSIGGVIRLTSKKPSEGRLKLSTDGIGGRSYQFETGLELEDAYIGIRKGFNFTPGWSAASEKTGNTERDSFESDNFQLYFEKMLNDKTEFSLNFDWLENLTELDGFSLATSLPIDSKTFRQKKLEGNLSFGLLFKHENGDLKFTHSFSHGGYTGIDEANVFNEYGLEYSRQIQTIYRDFDFGNSQLSLEASHQETYADNKQNYSNRELLNAFSIQYLRQLTNLLSISTSARLEDSNFGKSLSTGNLGLDYHKEQFSFSIELGNASRLPAFNERFYPNYGDPDLNAEFSNSILVKAGYQLKNICKLTAEATQFKIRDLIGTVSTTDPKYTWGSKAANLGKTKLQSHKFGIENISVKGFSISGFVQILDKAVIENSNTQPAGILSRQSGFKIVKNYKNYSAQLLSKWWGNSWETAKNDRGTNPGHDLSLTIARKTGKLTTILCAENLTDNSTERIQGYTRPGRRFKLAVETLF